MNLRYRKKIARIRILHKLARFMMYNSGFLFYHRIYNERCYDDIFRKLHNIEKNKRCFIVGNGPSLSIEDLEIIKKEDCFGSNEIHRTFSYTDWRPKYYVITDRYSKTTPEEIKRLECNYLFLSDYYWRFNKVMRDDAICLRIRYRFNDNTYSISDDISKYIMASPTVTFASIQIAIYLGYKEIYLLGVDHNYCHVFDKRGNVIDTGVQRNHFFEDDISEDIIADVYGMTRAYEAARGYCDTHGIIIRNLTRGGKLEVFEREQLEKVLEI